jgi:hypothetical protein
MQIQDRQSALRLALVGLRCPLIDWQNKMMNHIRFADELLHDFLQHVCALGGDVELVKVRVRL